MAVFYLCSRKLMCFTFVQHRTIHSIHSIHSSICSLRFTFRCGLSSRGLQKAQTPRQQSTIPLIHCVHPSTCSRSRSLIGVTGCHALCIVSAKNAPPSLAQVTLFASRSKARASRSRPFYPPPAKSTPTPILGASGGAVSYITKITRTHP